MNELSKPYFSPYFNKTSELFDAYQALAPEQPSAVTYAQMVGAMSVYIPEEIFNKLVADVRSRATSNVGG